MRNNRILQTIAVIVLLLLVWYAVNVLLLAFAGILLAVLLRGIASLISDYTRLPIGWSLAVTILLIVTVIGLGIWYLAPKIAGQADNIMESLPRSVNNIEEKIRQYSWGRRLLEQMPAPEKMLSDRQDTLSRITGAFSTTFGILTDVIIVLFIGLYLAVNPKTYLSGIKHLFPLDKRKRAAEVLEEIGRALRWWITGQLIIMLAVGTLTFLGLWLIGLPFSLALAFLAGLFEFIPFLGPILAFIPIILLALLDSPTTALYATGIYLLVQQAESYLITPLVQKKAVELPPALTVFSVVLMGVLTGSLGVLLATPLMVVVLVTVRMVYVRDILGDETVEDGIKE